MTESAPKALHDLLSGTYRAQKPGLTSRTIHKRQKPRPEWDIVG